MSNLLTPPAPRPAFNRTVSSTSQQSTKSSTALAISRTFSHQKNKLRLYLAVFSRGGSSGGKYGSQISCDSYHWAIVLGPKSALRAEAGTAYHIIHSASEFSNSPIFYEESDLAENPHLSRNLLARIALAKVIDEQRVLALLRNLAEELAVAPKSDTASTDGPEPVPTISCLSWAKSAWVTLSSDNQKPLKSYFGPEAWDDFENRARKYVKRKRQLGRYNPNILPIQITWNPHEVSTWNYWENRETSG